MSEKKAICVSNFMASQPTEEQIKVKFVDEERATMLGNGIGCDWKGCLVVYDTLRDSEIGQRGDCAKFRKSIIKKVINKVVLTE